MRARFQADVDSHKNLSRAGSDLRARPGLWVRWVGIAVGSGPRGPSNSFRSWFSESAPILFSYVKLFVKKWKLKRLEACWALRVWWLLSLEGIVADLLSFGDSKKRPSYFLSAKTILTCFYLRKTALNFGYQGCMVNRIVWSVSTLGISYVDWRPHPLLTPGV